MAYSSSPHNERWYNTQHEHNHNVTYNNYEYHDYHFAHDDQWNDNMYHKYEHNGTYHDHDTQEEEHDDEHNEQPTSTQKRRPRRNAKSRREQQQRSFARATTKLLQGLSSLQLHRGCQLSRAGQLLQQALQHNGNNEHDERYTSTMFHETTTASNGYYDDNEQLRPTRRRQQTRDTKHMPLCKHYLRGTCTFGVHCKFSHNATHATNATEYREVAHNENDEDHNDHVDHNDHYDYNNYRERNEYYAMQQQERSCYHEQNYEQYDDPLRQATQQHKPMQLHIKQMAPRDDRDHIKQLAPTDNRIDNKQMAPTDNRNDIEQMAPTDNRFNVKQMAPTDDRTFIKQMAPTDDRLLIKQTEPTDDRIDIKQMAPTATNVSNHYATQDAEQASHSSTMRATTYANYDDVRGNKNAKTFDDTGHDRYNNTDDAQHQASTSTRNSNATTKAGEQKDDWQHTATTPTKRLDDGHTTIQHQEPSAPCNYLRQSRETARIKKSKSSETSSKNIGINNERPTYVQQDENDKLRSNETAHARHDTQQHDSAKTDDVYDIINVLSLLEPRENDEALHSLPPHLLREVTLRMQQISAQMNADVRHNEEQVEKVNELVRQHLRLNNLNKKKTRLAIGSRQLQNAIVTMSQRNTQTSTNDNKKEASEETSTQHDARQTTQYEHPAIQTTTHEIPTTTTAGHEQEQNEEEINDIMELLLQGYNPRQAAKLVPPRMLQEAIKRLPIHIANTVHNYLQAAQNSDDDDSE